MNIIPYNSYWTQQFNQIKEQGFEAICRKLKTASRRLIIFILSLLLIPIILVIRFIKPWYWIRFGWFFGSRIGHFAFDVEYYLSEKKLGLHHDKVKDIFFYRWGKPANSFFSKLIERHLVVSNWVEPLFIANDMLPGGEHHKFLPAIVTCDSRDKDGLFRRAEVQLAFTNEQNKLGYSFLQSIGVDKKKFICLIARDSAYLKWSSYHNYRDSDINSYKVASLTLADKGYWVLRMGKKVNQNFQLGHPHVIDYANSEYRTDFLDIWLVANCFFCISNGTGLDEVARIFRRPAVYVNYLPFQQFVSYDHVISVPKHLIWKNNNEKLTLSEHLDNPFSRSEEYLQNNIHIQNLNNNEILHSVLELEDRLNNNFKESEQDRILQNKFWEIFTSHPDFEKYNGKLHPKARVGAHFLRNNPEWLN